MTMPNRYISKHLIVLFIIFVLAIVVRFWFFKQSTYFGYDEARDAYISQSIYLNGDLKLIGPPAGGGFAGLFHGPLHWYILGPLYLLGKGNPYFVSAIYRILNSLGIFLVFYISRKLFNNSVGLISSLIYAFSFEQTQYAMYVGNPTLAIFSIMGIFLGASILYKDKNNKGIILMFICAAVGIQFHLILLYTFILIPILFFILKIRIKAIPVKIYLISLLSAGLILSTYAIAEFKYHFQLSKTLIDILKSNPNVMPSTDTRFSLYIRMFLKLIQYNIANIPSPYLVLLTILILACLIYFSFNNKSLLIVLAWVFSGSLLLLFTGYDALYVNIGLGIGVIIACSYLLNKLLKLNKVIFFILIALIIISNLLLIRNFNPQGLIVELKPQPYMKLSDESIIMDNIYKYAGDRGFTIRVTGIPYSIQTTWAYLLNYYGKDHFGYLPYWEGQMVYGYPGSLPTPTMGTTCVRFLIRDPIRGLPQNLIQKDIKEENLFSNLIKEESVGGFLLQTRIAKDPNCHNIKVI
jgi:hypothetical protein